MRKYSLALVVILGLLICRIAAAQQNIPGFAAMPGTSYSYIDLQAYKSFLDSNSTARYSQVNDSYKKEFKEILEKKNKELVEEIGNSNYLFGNPLNNYLGAIFNELLDKNNLPRSSFHFFVSRSAEPNACALEDGTVIFNLGMFSVVRNESQLAMAMAHEISHYLLEHTNRGIVMKLERLNSPEFIAQVKAIKKQSYNRKSQLEELLITDLFNRRKHDRSQETAADSLGMILMGKTSFSLRAVPSLFDALDVSPETAPVCTLNDFFANNGIAAEEGWFKPTKRITFGSPTPVGKKGESLQTHPDCAKRKLYAEKYIAQHPEKETKDFVLGNADSLSLMQATALYEQLQYLKDKQQLSYYLYSLIQANARFPQCNTMTTEIFETVSSLCNHLQNHSFVSVVDKVNNNAEEKDEYAKLLRMLDRTSLQQLASIALAYYSKNKALIDLQEGAASTVTKLKLMQ